ncbi:MAG: ribosome biogenesis GTPase Der [Candidatus Berkelbacteria bacterium]|nr:ribosome biogenesis GTPase Der [Candidatus Berkelbacteria bacterium]
MNEKLLQNPTVAIVGRPNVGKSTFFNRLVGSRKAIESETPGTTRDRIYSQVEWCGKEFTLIDTAGLFDNASVEEISNLTKTSINVAIDQADIIIFLVDVTEIGNDDREIAKILRKSGKKVFLAANKADNANREIPTREAFSLGFGQPNYISAISGRGVGDFLDTLTENFSTEKSTDEKVKTINVALIGRPNVGKSTLLNKMIGEDKAIVSDIPGTTRDSTDGILDFAGEKINFIDTAGIRRRGKIEVGIEKFSIIRTLGAIDDSSVVVILIDAEEGLTNQDAHVIGQAKEQGKSIVIAVNKFDLWDKEENEEIKNKMAITLGKLQHDLAFVPFVPVVFLSAKTGANQKVLLKKIIEVYKQRFIEIEKDEIKEIVFAAKDRNPQIPKIIDFYQEKTNPIVFKLICPNKNHYHFSHLRYLENVIRDHYPFTGTPIFIDLIDKKS